MAERFTYNMSENNDRNPDKKDWLPGDEYEKRELDFKKLDKVTPIPGPGDGSAKIVDIPLDSEFDGDKEAVADAHATGDKIDKDAVLAFGNTRRKPDLMLPSQRTSGWSRFRRLGAAALLVGGTALGVTKLTQEISAQAPNTNPQNNSGAQVAEHGMQSITDANNLLNRNPNNLTPEARPSSTIHPADPEKNR